MATNDRVEFILLRELRQVTAESTQGGRFDIFLSGRFAASAIFLLGFRRSKIGIKLLENLVTRPLDIDFEALQNASRHAFSFAQETKENVLGADVGMVQRLCFLPGKREHLLHARRVRDVPDHLGFRTGTDLFLDLHPDRLEIHTHLLQHVDRNALPKFDQPEQEMLGADIVVIEAVCFLACERQNLLGSRSKIIHYLEAPKSHRSPTPAPLY